MRLTPTQKEVITQLENGGSILAFTDLSKNVWVNELTDKDGNVLKDLTGRTITALEAKGLLIGKLKYRTTHPDTETHCYSLNTEKWAKIKPVKNQPQS